jgi:hypothetical protein
LLPRGAFGFSTGFVGRGFGLAITFGFTGFIAMLLTLLG